MFGVRKIESIETNQRVDPKTLKQFGIKYAKDLIPSTNEFNEISYKGLNKYLKERIFGHDEEIDRGSHI